LGSRDTPIRLGSDPSRVLTLRELNRATLARQLLLERRRLAPTTVIERLVGMQAQWPPAPYVGIWTRTTSFRRETLERALAGGAVVKATVMRQTLHLVTQSDYWLLRSAMSETNFPWESRLAKRLAPVARALADKGPVRTADAIVELAEHDLGGLDARRAWRYARAAAHLVHHHETGLWHARPEGRFVALDEPCEQVPVEARAEMLRRYLGAFGPATRRDIVAWSMMHVPEITAGLELLEPLRRFRDEHGRELLDVQGAPLPSADTPAPVRFLPKWDNVLLAFHDRSRILPEEIRKRVIRANGDVAQTLLVDGFVAGTWRAEAGRVAVEPFAPLPRGVRREVAEEAARLEAFLGDDRGVVES
jgi:Winged helix DNA-binding domain